MESDSSHLVYVLSCHFSSIVRSASIFLDCCKTTLCSSSFEFSWDLVRSYCIVKLVTNLNILQNDFLQCELSAGIRIRLWCLFNTGNKEFWFKYLLYF